MVSEVAVLTGVYFVKTLTFYEIMFYKFTVIVFLF